MRIVMPLIKEPTLTNQMDQNGVHSHDGHAGTGQNGRNVKKGRKVGQTSDEREIEHKLDESKTPSLNGASPLDTDVQNGPFASSCQQHNNAEVNGIDTNSQNGYTWPSSSNHYSSLHQNGDSHISPDVHQEFERSNGVGAEKSSTNEETSKICSSTDPLASTFCSPRHSQNLINDEKSSEYHTTRDPLSPTQKHFRQMRDLELSIPLYYAGKYVFLTGATGFIGKVFVEKLLRSCPDIGGIFCLIRPKNKQTVQERLADFVDSSLFDNLRDQPNLLSKLHPVEGDVLLPDLGLSAEDSRTLQDHVNVVFHSAATIRFTEPLRSAVEMNVVAVRKMLHLARKCRHLEAFVHVSTAYANCDISYIEEKVYPPAVEPQKIIDVLSWMDDEMVELFTPKLLGEKPNTYTYTKQLAEHLLVTEGADLPLAIVRPSIVGAAWREPVAGWIDNSNGPSGIYIAAGKGVLRCMKGEKNAVADIVPVDIPVNIMIAVGWYTAVAKPKTVQIYHATSGGTNPLRWGEIEAVLNKTFKRNPLEKCFRRPKVSLVNSSFFNDYWTYASHLCPAYVCDMAFALIGRKPRMVKMYNKLHYSIDVFKFFTCNEWQWESSNLEILRRRLTHDDLRMFYFDMRPLHWPTYIENHCLGAKKYVLNEDLSGLPAARAHLLKLRIIRTLFNSAICAILWRVLIAKSQFARNLWFFIVSLVFKFVRFFRITSTMHK